MQATDFPCVPRLTAWVVALATTFVAAPLSAQATRTTVPTSTATSRVLRIVDNLIARADTSAAIALLDSAVASEPRNGALWHTLGVLNWGGRAQSVRALEGEQVLARRIRADTALRLATQVAPDSGQYWLDFGRFVRFTDNSARRGTLRDLLSAPAQLAQRSGHAKLASALLDEQGLIAFRNYDLVANRAIVSNPNDARGVALPQSVDKPFLYGPLIDPRGLAKVQETFAQTPRHKWAQWFERNAVLVTPPSGAADFEVAQRAFSTAVDLDPTNGPARTHLFMVLAESRDWPALLLATERTIRRDSGDADAWLARGLATQRVERYKDAAVSFDNALRQMDDSAQLAFTNLSRLLTPNKFANDRRFPDSISFARLDATQRRRWETLYWNLADPRARTTYNEARLEYLARVTFADLRYGYEELRVRGSESARGMIHIRFGAPDHTYGPGDAVWTYRNGRIFFFRRAMTYGNVRLGPAEERVVRDSILILEPSGWENMPLVRKTWPMRMRVARFRATADSMDAVITAAVPVRSFLGDAELSGRFPIEVQLDVHDSASRTVGRELRKVTVSSDSLPVGINGTWVRRLGPGLNVVRIDAEQDDVGRAASATSDALLEKGSGFGMSDILFGTNPQRIGDKDPARWRDVSIAPTIGLFVWNQPLGLVWENYGLAAVDGNVNYRTTISLHRTFESTVKGFAARLKANLRNVLEMDASGTGSVTVSYDQLRPSAAVVTDFLSISLSGAVPGPYRLDVEIFDKVSGRSTKRTTEFVLTPN